jgi:cob(I)alamin adenosyltransferase
MLPAADGKKSDNRLRVDGLFELKQYLTKLDHKVELHTEQISNCMHEMENMNTQLEELETSIIRCSKQNTELNDKMNFDVNEIWESIESYLTCDKEKVVVGDVNEDVTKRISNVEEMLKTISERLSKLQTAVAVKDDDSKKVRIRSTDLIKRPTS